MSKEEKLVKFRITSEVSTFQHQHKEYKPGDIVELPERFRGKTFLTEIVPAEKRKKEPKPPIEETVEETPSEETAAEEGPAEEAERAVEATAEPEIPVITKETGLGEKSTEITFAESPRCTATTSRGLRCLNPALPGSEFCKTHQPKEETETQ